MKEINRYKNMKLRKVIVKLWNDEKKSSKEIANNKTVRRLWGKGVLNANIIGFFIAELRRVHGVNLTYRGHKWQLDHYKSRIAHARIASAHLQIGGLPSEGFDGLKLKPWEKLLKIGALLNNEEDATKYLTKILIDAINNDFRKLWATEPESCRKRMGENS